MNKIGCGGFYLGENLSFDEQSKTLNATGGSELTPATASTLGGVKIGEGINVTSDGTISASGGGGYDAIIKVEHEFSTVTSTVLLGGDYNTIRTKLENNEPCNVSVIEVESDPECGETYTYQRIVNVTILDDSEISFICVAMENNAYVGILIVWDEEEISSSITS